MTSPPQSPNPPPQGPESGWALVPVWAETRVVWLSAQTCCVWRACLLQGPRGRDSPRPTLPRTSGHSCPHTAWSAGRRLGNVTSWVRTPSLWAALPGTVLEHLSQQASGDQVAVSGWLRKGTRTARASALSSCLSSGPGSATSQSPVAWTVDMPPHRSLAPCHPTDNVSLMSQPEWSF